MNFPHLSAQMARHLKSLGFAQPSPEVGQIWFSQLDIPFEIKDFNPFVGFLVENLNNGLPSFFGGQVSEGMVYCPTIEEAYVFRQRVGSVKN